MHTNFRSNWMKINKRKTIAKWDFYHFDFSLRRKTNAVLEKLELFEKINNDHARSFVFFSCFSRKNDLLNFLNVSDKSFSREIITVGKCVEAKSNKTINLSAVPNMHKVTFITVAIVSADHICYQFVIWPIIASAGCPYRPYLWALSIGGDSSIIDSIAYKRETGRHEAWSIAHRIIITIKCNCHSLLPLSFAGLTLPPLHTSPPHNVWRCYFRTCGKLIRLTPFSVVLIGKFLPFLGHIITSELKIYGMPRKCLLPSLL